MFSSLVGMRKRRFSAGKLSRMEVRPHFRYAIKNMRMIAGKPAHSHVSDSVYALKTSNRLSWLLSGMLPRSPSDFSSSALDLLTLVLDINSSMLR